MASVPPHYKGSRSLGSATMDSTQFLTHVVNRRHIARSGPDFHRRLTIVQSPDGLRKCATLPNGCSQQVSEKGSFWVTPALPVEVNDWIPLSQLEPRWWECADGKTRR
jgi:hypothetical protein